MHILIVEDEPGLRTELEILLRGQHYDVVAVPDGKQVLELLYEQEFALVLLDVMLPDQNGFSVLQTMRTMGILTSVLILTAREAISDRIQGLDSGADDYLTKPFSSDELLARVRALLRRGSSAGSAVLEVGSLKLDTARREATLTGQPLKLTPTEFRLLEFLLYSKNNAVSRFNLAEHVWGNEFDPFTMSNSLEVHIKNLRHKLGNEGTLLVTVRGTGYMLKDPSP